jgi:hypothetical protein
MDRLTKRNSYGGISQWRMSALTKSKFNPSPTIAQLRMDALTKKDWSVQSNGKYN